MATPNLVPRADSEGGLGTSGKRWGSVHAREMYLDGRSVGDRLSEPLATRWINENGVHCDGATPGMRAYWPLVTPDGVDQSPGTGDFTLIAAVRVPETLPLARVGLFGIGSVNNDWTNPVLTLRLE